MIEYCQPVKQIGPNPRRKHTTRVGARGGLLWLFQSGAKASTRINYPTKEDAKAAYAAIVKALGGGE